MPTDHAGLDELEARALQTRADGASRTVVEVQTVLDVVASTRALNRELQDERAAHAATLAERGHPPCDQHTGTTHELFRVTWTDGAGLTRTRGVYDTLTEARSQHSYAQTLGVDAAVQRASITWEDVDEDLGAARGPATVAPTREQLEPLVRDKGNVVYEWVAKCPVCGARPGDACYGNGPMPRRMTHPSRVSLSREAWLTAHDAALVRVQPNEDSLIDATYRALSDRYPDIPMVRTANLARIAVQGILALLPGRTEAEVRAQIAAEIRAEAKRRYTHGDLTASRVIVAVLDDIAEVIAKEADR